MRFIRAHFPIFYTLCLFAASILGGLVIYYSDKSKGPAVTEIKKAAELKANALFPLFVLLVVAAIAALFHQLSKRR